MKRIIACIVACISLFFGVACKDKQEKVEYEEGHVFLTDDFFGFEEGELEKELVTRGFKIVDKSKVSKEEYRYYADSFEMGFDRLILFFAPNGDEFLCIAEYRDETTAIYYEKKANSIWTNYFRYRNLLVVDVSGNYRFLGLTTEHASGCLLYEEGKTFVLYSDKQQSTVTFELFDGIERIAGSAFKTCNFERLICNNQLRLIGAQAFKDNKYLETVILNDGLKEIGNLSFYGCENFEYTVIPLSVEKIGEQAFSHGNIFCEAEAKPNGWADDFYCEQAKVYWKGEWAYNENGKPVPLVQEEPPQEDGVAT